jgi:hypothetical protein
MTNQAEDCIITARRSSHSLQPMVLPLLEQVIQLQKPPSSPAKMLKAAYLTLVEDKLRSGRRRSGQSTWFQRRKAIFAGSLVLTGGGDPRSGHEA